MKTLIISSFSFFPTYLPYSSSYLTGLLRENDIEATQLDMNACLWDFFLSTDFLSRLSYSELVFTEGLPCPFCPSMTSEEFALIKEDVIQTIDEAKVVLKDPKRFYVFSEFKWAMDVVQKARKLIYGSYGVFFEGHMVFWKDTGLLPDSISKIYDLANNHANNPFVNAINERIFPIISEIDPGLIMMDVVWPWDIVGVLTFNRMIKERNMKIHLNFPGQGFDEFSFLRFKERLKNSEELFFGFDSVFVTRNDEQLPQFIEKIETGDFSDIRSLAYMKGGNVLINEPMVQGGIIESVTPDYSDLKLDLYFTPSPVIVEYLSSKCFWAKCYFCAINTTKKKRQVFDTQHLIRKIIKNQTDIGCNHVWFLDEACTPEEALNMANELIRENVKIYWSIRTRIDKNYTYETLKRLHESGCRELWIGLEHISPRLLKIMNKTEAPDDYTEIASSIIRHCSELGIGIHFCLIIGFPSETTHDRQALIDFFKDHRAYFNKIPLFLTFNKFMLVPGSYMHKNGELFGITEISENPDEYAMDTVKYKTKWNDQTSSTHMDGILDETIYSLLGTVVRNEMSDMILWFNVSDSAYEILVKSHYSSMKRNPFLCETREIS